MELTLLDRIKRLIIVTLDNSLFLLKIFGFYGLMGYMTIYSLWRNYRACKSQRTALSTLAQPVA